MSLRWRGPTEKGKDAKSAGLLPSSSKGWEFQASPPRGLGSLNPIPEGEDFSDDSERAEAYHTLPEEPGPYPHISLLLDIYPKVLERRFWQSTTWKRSMRNVDIFFFLYVLVNNVTILAATNSKFPAGSLLLHREISWLYIALGLLQTYCSFCYAPFYQRARPLLVYLNRAIRFGHLALIIVSLTGCMATGACIPVLQAELLAVPAQPLLNTVRFAYVLTGSFISGLHSISLRLPLKGQIAFQAAYLALTLRTSTHAATHILSHPDFVAPTATLCHALDTLSFTLASASAGMYQDPTPMCTPQLAPLLLVLFTQFFFGFLAPVLISYHLERALKATYLQNEAELAVVDPPTLCTTLIRTAFVTALFAAVCWQLALRFHLPIALWATPTMWPGADSSWFTALVASANANAAATMA